MGYFYNIVELYQSELLLYIRYLPPANRFAVIWCWRRYFWQILLFSAVLQNIYLFRFTSDDIERIARKANDPEKKPDSFCADTCMDGDAGFEDAATEPKQVGGNFVLVSQSKIIYETYIYVDN